MVDLASKVKKLFQVLPEGNICVVIIHHVIPTIYQLHGSLHITDSQFCWDTPKNTSCSFILNTNNQLVPLLLTINFHKKKSGHSFSRRHSDRHSQSIRCSHFTARRVPSLFRSRLHFVILKSQKRRMEQVLFETHSNKKEFMNKVVIPLIKKDCSNA